MERKNSKKEKKKQLTTEKTAKADRPVPSFHLKRGRLAHLVGLGFLHDGYHCLSTSLVIVDIFQFF
jgi:hypothetical protein